MKTLRIITCLIAVVCGTVTVSAEEFFPTGTTWTEAWFTPEMKFDDAEIHSYEVGADTIINGKTYRKICVDGQERGLWIREEQGKVLLLRDDFPQEIMLYNFDWYSYSDDRWNSDRKTMYQYTCQGKLKEDTIHYSIGWTGAMEDNQERPCISFNSSYMKVMMIRGIGRITEPVMDCCILGSRRPETVLPDIRQCRLLTFTRNGKVVYDYKKQFEGYEIFTRDVPTAGIDMYFYVTWHRMIKRDYYSLDSISGHRIYISAHYHTPFDEAEGYSGSKLLLNLFEAGEYRIVLSAVDDSGFMPDIVMEYPFTVRENPVDVPCGLIHTSVAGEKEKDVIEAIEEGLIPDYGTPAIDATLEGDSLHITGWFRFQITDHYCYYEIHGDSVYLETVETPGIVTGGWPLFSVDFKIGPFTGERVTIQVAHLLGALGIGEPKHYSSTHTFDFTSVRLPEGNNTISPGTLYDLTGRPADGTKKGIYIKNGRKVLVK